MALTLDDVIHWMREASGRGRAERAAAAERDPWRRFDLEPPLRAFGPGAHADFAHFLQRPSRVEAPTPGDVARWLLGCRYADDAILLDEADHWQHPCTFELLRCGDCEDFSLWAWRKLADARYDSEFVVGMRRRPDGTAGRHAWVLFRDRGEQYLLDGVERALHRIIRPVAAVHAEYEPQVGVNAACERFVFAGLYRSDWGRMLVLPRTKRRR